MPLSETGRTKSVLQSFCCVLGFFLLKWLVFSSISEKVSRSSDSNRDVSDWGKPVAAARLGQKLRAARRTFPFSNMEAAAFDLWLLAAIVRGNHTLWAARATTEAKQSCGSFRTGCYFNELNKSYIGPRASLEFSVLQSSAPSPTFEPGTLWSSEKLRQPHAAPISATPATLAQEFTCFISQLFAASRWSDFSEQSLNDIVLQMASTAPGHPVHRLPQKVNLT